MANIVYSKALAEYELINWVGGHRQYFGRFGTVDLTRISKPQIDRLIQMGFSKFKEKASKKAS